MILCRTVVIHLFFIILIIKYDCIYNYILKHKVMSDYNSLICLCGKKKLKLNETNWKRHLTFCSVSKLKKSNIVNDVSCFFYKKNVKLMKYKICRKKVIIIIIIIK